ncbi:hypothetical protein G8C36_23300 (plasmid) [Gordonia terrae]|nr:hypothetical protein G8C36_23300 [Gordonia terrae]
MSNPSLRGDVDTSTARTFAARTRHHGAPLRRGFLMRLDGERSPVETLMNASRGVGGGRGGRTRLAVLLTALWVNSGGDYSSTRPARWWAEMIGEPDPVAAARKITTTLRELNRRGFLVLTEGAGGVPATVTLLDERGSGEPYTRPDGTTGAYFRIPEQLWTTGLIARLSGPGLVMYLATLYYHHRNDQGVAPPVWFVGKSFHERHGLSEDTRLDGLRNLEDNGAVYVDTISIDNTGNRGQRTYSRRLFTLLPAYEPPRPESLPPADDADSQSSTRSGGAGPPRERRTAF